MLPFSHFVIKQRGQSQIFLKINNCFAELCRLIVNRLENLGEVGVEFVEFKIIHLCCTFVHLW